jgi:predicted outer membrane repeat protein
MRFIALIGLVALFAVDAANAGWPVIGHFSSKSAKRRVAAMKMSTAVDPVTGEMSGRVGLDLAAVGDDDAGWFDATFVGFAKDVGIYAGTTALAKIGYDTVVHYRNKGDGDSSASSESVSDQGGGIYATGDLTIENSQVDTNNKDIRGKNITIKESVVNTGSVQEDE